MKSRTKNRGEQKERNREPVRTQLPWTIKLPHTTRRDHTVSLFFLELFPLYGNYVLLSVSSSPYSLGYPPSGSILDSAPFVTLSMLGLLKPFCLLSLSFPFLFPTFILPLSVCSSIRFYSLTFSYFRFYICISLLVSFPLFILLFVIVLK